MCTSGVATWTKWVHIYEHQAGIGVFHFRDACLFMSAPVVTRRPVKTDEICRGQGPSRRNQIDEGCLDVTVLQLHAFLFNEVPSF